MNRVVISIFGIFLLLSSSVLAGDFEPGSEPEGFRGIVWGTEIGDLSGFTLIRREPRFGGMDVYSREGEKLSAWGAPVGAIEYFFRKGKFYRGSVLTASTERYQALQKGSLREVRGGGSPAPGGAGGDPIFLAGNDRLHDPPVRSGVRERVADSNLPKDRRPDNGGGCIPLTGCNGIFRNLTPMTLTPVNREQVVVQDFSPACFG